MFKLWKKFKDYLFDYNVPFEKRMNLIFLTTSITASFFGILICLLAGVTFSGVSSVAFIFVATVLTTIISRKHNHETFGLWFVIIAIMIAMPIVWLTAGGITSGVNVWFVYELLFFTFILSGKRLITVLSIAGLLDSSCYIISIYRPEWVNTFTENSSIYLSTGLSTIIVSIAIMVKAIYQRSLYNDEHNKLEEAYKTQERLKQEAESANKAKGDFLASMSHEIRTPINAVLGLNEMILRGANKEEIQEYAKNIKHSGNILLSLINDILDFSKIESGKMDIIPTKYKPASILDELLLMISPKAKEQGLEFKTEIAEDIPSVLYGDDIRIMQILTNLLTNAIKYTNKGNVTLKVSCSNDGDDYVIMHVSVIDTGIGIKDEDLEKLFVSFQRLDEVRNRKIQGTGLGLTITANLLQLMGSSLQVESVYGKGSTFHFDIRQKIIEASPIGNQQDHFEKSKNDISIYHESFIAPHAKILAVDDNQTNLMVVKGLLKNTKMQITLAESGKEALQQMQLNKFDIILMDHMMPEMDGIETVKRSKQLENNMSANAKIIALTANAVSGARELFLANGFDDFLAKPVQGKQLEQAFLKHLPKKLVTIIQTKEQQPQKTTVPVNGLVNFNQGRNLCANDDSLYRKILQSLAHSSISQELQNYYDEQDWDNYVIKVHTLKSNLANIGADTTSKKARDIEFALRDGNIPYAQINHSVVMLEFKKIIAEIKAYLEN